MELIKKISSNPKLVAFCNKILAYNTILESDETRHLFLASLISADTLVDKESCQETLDTAYFIINHMDFFQLEDSVRKEIEDYMEKTIEVAFKELRMFKKEEKE